MRTPRPPVTTFNSLFFTDFYLNMWARIGQYGVVLLWGLWLAGCSGEAAPQPRKADASGLSSQVSYCVGGDVAFNLEQAMACEYVARAELPHKGINASEQWIRLKIDSPLETIGSVAVHVGPHYLRDIRFFEYKNQQWTEDFAGSQYPFSDGRVNIGGYTFIASLDSINNPSKNNIYYIKVLSDGLNNFNIKTEAWPPTVGSRINQQIGLGIQIGALVLITLFSMVSYALNPNPVMGRLIFAMGNVVLCVLAGSGLLARYVFFDHPWLDAVFFSWVIFLRLALWVWVGQAFLKPYKAPSWYTLSCNAVYLVTAVGLLLIALDQNAVARPLMFFAILVAPIIQIFAIAATPGIRPSFRTVLISGFVVADVLIVLAVYFVNALSGESSAAIYISRLIDFINPVVVLIIMAIQNRLTREELAEASSKLMELNIRSDFEKKMLAERRVLIDMLTHELKNPLASISMAIGSLKMSLPDSSSAELRRLHNISQSIENMDAIIEKCSLMNTVDQKLEKIKIEPFNLNGFLQELIQQQASSQRFKLINFDGLVIQSDRNLLKVAVNNILENADKYSVDGSVVLVQVLKIDEASNANKFEIVVTNKINEAWAPDPDLLFNRFYRHPLALQTAGSGLGLYLVEEICRLLGGAVRYTRTPDSVKFHIEVSA